MVPQFKCFPMNGHVGMFRQSKMFLGNFCVAAFIMHFVMFLPSVTEVTPSVLKELNFCIAIITES
jgi:hypothetical protein